MSICELAVYPQTAYVEGQGLVGTRKWVLDHNDQLDEFLLVVSNSHWPGSKDCFPVRIQSGAYQNAEAIVERACDSPRSRQTMGDLPKYNKYMVVAQYALHRRINCWPLAFGTKPYHPTGTTLSLSVKGSGQYIIASPAGMRSMAPETVLCGDGGETPQPSYVARVIIRLSEYHVTCDRLTKKQLNKIFTITHWDVYQGCVNSEGEVSEAFLNAPAGTLLFDGYNLQETRVCHSKEPLRYRLTAVFKRRVVLKTPPTPDVEATNDLLIVDGLSVGWNHDYINVNTDDQRWGWKYIKIWQSTEEGPNDCVPRYAYRNFAYLFADNKPEDLEGYECDDEEETPELLADDAFCLDE